MCQIESFKDAKWHVEGGECMWSCPSWLAWAPGVTSTVFCAHSSHKGFINKSFHALPKVNKFSVHRLPKHRREEWERTQHDVTI